MLGRLYRKGDRDDCVQGDIIQVREMKTRETKVSTEGGIKTYTWGGRREGKGEEMEGGRED